MRTTKNMSMPASLRTTLFSTAAAATAALTVLTPTAAPASPGTAPAGAPTSSQGPCGAGQLCLWAEEDFGGLRHTYELSGTDIESCVVLPKGAEAHALANRTGRPVTTYQSAECAETGEFDTHPGSGTWQPKSPYEVRAFKIWEN